MSDNNIFSNFVNSIFGKDDTQPDGEQNTSLNDKPKENEINPRRIYNGEMPISRRIYIWGHDEQNNPCFVVFFGEHQFKTTNGQQLLNETVRYPNYIILRGNEGHFPSFENFSIRQTWHSDPKKRKNNLYYKKDVRNNYWGDSKNAIPDFVTIPNGGIEVAFYDDLTHKGYVDIVKQNNLQFDNFVPVNNPSDILNLDSDMMSFYDDTVILLSRPNIYTRKKILKSILSKQPSEKLLKHLLKIGSTELVSGLFLELAKEKNGVLLGEAYSYAQNICSWAPEAYAYGVKRTAQIYINTFDENYKKIRLEMLENTLTELRMNPISLGKNTYPEDMEWDGDSIRKFSMQGLFSKYSYEYSSESGRYERIERSGIYKSGYYTNGLVLDKIKLKSTIQESDIYQSYNIIGKVAHYLDAPGMVYYGRNNGETKAINYFRKLIVRIVDELPQKDPEKFMEVMVNLFTNYSDGDYIGDYIGDFQRNFFIRQYLYRSFDNPRQDSWYDRYTCMSPKQLTELTGRYEFMPEIWNNHLDAVIEIACKTKVLNIARAMFFILDEDKNKAKLQSCTFEQLIQLSCSVYAPLAKLGYMLIKIKLNKETQFNADLMISLMYSDNDSLKKLGVKYFESANGSFTPQVLATFLLLPDLENWTGIINDNISRLDGDQYFEFLSLALEKLSTADNNSFEWNDTLSDLLNATSENFLKADVDKKAVVFVSIIKSIMENDLVDEKLLQFMEGLIFTLEINELKLILSNKNINLSAFALKGGLIYTMLDALKNNIIPSDIDIMNVLELGTTQMVRKLVELSNLNTEIISQRESTMLVMLESDVSALNELAKEIFETMQSEKQLKMHFIILDSPHEKVYNYGIQKLYDFYLSKEAPIPKDFIIKMLEHPAKEVKEFIANKINDVIVNMQSNHKDIFMYYAKTLLLLPNKLSKDKKLVYSSLPRFVEKYPDKKQEVEELLLEIGGSNVILHSENALVTLAMLSKEAV